MNAHQDDMIDAGKHYNRRDASDPAPRTLEQVQTFMANAAKNRSALSAARLLLRHGRMTDDAKAWLMRTYGQSE